MTWGLLKSLIQQATKKNENLITSWCWRVMCDVLKGNMWKDTFAQLCDIKASWSASRIICDHQHNINCEKTLKIVLNTQKNELQCKQTTWRSKTSRTKQKLWEMKKELKNTKSKTFNMCYLISFLFLTNNPPKT